MLDISSVFVHSHIETMCVKAMNSCLWAGAGFAELLTSLLGFVIQFFRTDAALWVDTDMCAVVQLRKCIVETC